MPFSATRGYKMEGIQNLITHLEILHMEKQFSEFGDCAKELSDRPCLIWFGFVGSFYSPAGFPKAEVLLSCPCMCLALIAVLAVGQSDSVCQRVNKWWSLWLGRSSVLAHWGLWRHRMGQKEVQKSIIMRESVRRWNAPANFSYLGHVLQAVQQFVCRSR